MRYIFSSCFTSYQSYNQEKKMNHFTISNIEWKEFPMHPEKFDGYQLSIKCKVVFEKAIEKNDEDGYGDDKFSFTLIALDDEGYAILEVDFWDYSLPPVGKKSRMLSKRFACEQEECDLIHSWVLK